jgi:hypothetical protein
MRTIRIVNWQGINVWDSNDKCELVRLTRRSQMMETPFRVLRRGDVLETGGFPMMMSLKTKLTPRERKPRSMRVRYRLG